MDHPGTSILESDHPLLASALAKRADPDRGTTDQSYFDHVVQVYIAWTSLIEVHRTVICRIAGQTGVSEQAILQSSLLCVALHDVGKLSENFQRMMRAKDDKELRLAISMNFRHEVIPLCLIRALSQKLGLSHGTPVLGNGLLEMFAVAGHHKYLADGYLLNEEKFIQRIVWNNPLTWSVSVRSAVSLCEAMFREQGWDCPGISKSDVMLSYTLNKENLDNSIPTIIQNNNAAWNCLSIQVKELLRLPKEPATASFRPLFSLLKGLLMTADWMASGTSEKSNLLNAHFDTVRIRRESVKPYLVERCKEKNKLFSGFLSFQLDCSKVDGHVLAVAPTGSGKTEAAMLWGLNQIESASVKKLIFLMPTMVTANSLHRRMSDFFGKYEHDVALVHSTADLINAEKASGENDETDSESRSDAYDLRAPHLFSPVTVGTIDQLLVTLMHSGRWAMKTLAMANSAVVIDELHAYDPHTAGLVMLMMKQMSEMGTRFMVMSATMPSDLRRAVVETLRPQAITTIEDSTLLQKSRNRWETKSMPLTHWLGMKEGHTTAVSANFNELCKLLNHKEKPVQILIVVNTVKRCQDIAKHLQSFNPVCYHSKFIFKHRQEKEASIENSKPTLLVATQVVEVSLDIDYDILLTECAPIDALIQRAGRVNRSRRDSQGTVIVFPPEKGSDRIYGEPIGLLESTWDTLTQNSPKDFTEQDLLDLVEKVYAGKDLSKHRDYLGIQSETLELQKRLTGVLDSPRPYEDDSLLKTRLDSYAQATVIPSKYADDCKSGRFKERRKYELKVPVWYASKNKHEEATPDLPICDMEYDEQYGARLLPVDHISDPGNLVF